MSLFDYFSGRKVLEEVDSLHNGRLSVIHEVGFGKVIWGGGLPQSGGLAKTIWEKSLKEIKIDYPEINSILILGFGGGGIAHIARKLWNNTRIVGVDIDPVIVDLGKRYLKWENTKALVEIQDAEKYISKRIKNKRKYDIVCVDMYIGDAVPEKFNSVAFIKKVRKIVSPRGSAIFNRLYGARDKKLAHSFAKKLENEFEEVYPIYPHANIMYVCKGRNKKS